MPKPALVDVVLSILVIAILLALVVSILRRVNGL